MKYQIVLAFIALFFKISLGFAQYSTPIALQENVRYGKLQNGMTYYILHNEEPKERASFYFVQNVGAILEEDHQNGLAHFLEHMAFNGTQNFQGKGIINYLEKYGIKFGANINAYTSRDETVYNISDVPVANKGLLDSCLLVLHDWSGYLNLEEKEIDSERGVIREEWRTRRNVSKRIMDQTMPFIYYGSKYAKRDVIGDLDVINNFSYQSLRDYYKKWYRPDLQALVVVGDIDVNRMEKKVKEHFSGIPVAENPAPRSYETLPSHKESLFCVAKDKEANATVITLYYKKKTETRKDEKYKRRSFVESMYRSMLYARFQEVQQDTSSANLSIKAGFSGMGRLNRAFYLRISPKEDQSAKAFEQLLVEMERVNRYGFTPSELSRTKKKFSKSYESYFKNRSKVDNNSWAGKLQGHFLKAEPVLSIEDECAFASKTIGEISLQEINEAAKSFMTADNRVLVVSGPDNEDYLEEQEFEAIFTKVQQSKIAAYKEEDMSAALITEEIVSGKITDTFGVENTDAKGFVLSNGIRVVLFPTEYSKDEIVMGGFSLGGISLLPSQDIPSASLAASLVSKSGLGAFNKIQLRKKLAGKQVGVNPSLGTYTEGLLGAATSDDLETLMQLSWLNFQQPRFDPSVFQNLMSKMRNALINRHSDNSLAFQDSVTLSIANHHPRNPLVNKDYVDAISFEKMKRIYKERFANAADFTFVLVGNLDVEQARPLMEKYLGSLPGRAAKENWKDWKVRLPKGKTLNAFSRDMETPKASVFYEISDNMDFESENRMMLKMIGELLDKRYLETIREAEGGSYGVGVNTSSSQIPYEYFRMRIYFDCDPEKEERLSEIVMEEIERLKKDGPVVADLDKIRENLIKTRAEKMQGNSFWLYAIRNSLMNNQPVILADEYEALVNGITAKQLQKFAKKILKKPDMVKVKMVPAEK